MMFALLLLGQAPVPAEDVAAPIPAGFVSAFNAEQGPIRIEERIPRGETVERWTQMVTIQRFAGGARIGAAPFLERVRGAFVACSGSTATPVAGDAADARVRVDCPKNEATGKPEVMFARAFAGTDNLYVVQYAFRAIPSPAEAAQAQAYLAAVTLCGGTASACPTPR